MMDRHFYIESNKYFEKMLKSLNYDFLDDYSFENLSKLRDIFSKISTYNGRILYGSHVNPREIIPTFISVIESFGNKELLEYYKEKISSVPIRNTKYLKKSDSCLDICFLEDHIDFSAILMPRGKTRYADIASYSHEMGHIADMENKDKDKVDHYEFSEVLPILLEYFTFIKLLGDAGETLFYRERLGYEKNAAVVGVSSIDFLKSELGSFDEDKYYMYDVAGTNKYLLSSDFAFQFIDLLNKDRAELYRLLSSTLMGEKSVLELGNTLDIDTSGCKRLIKEYEKRMKK